ncbi:hypothetical protein ACA910_011148 [Epithemia clementina (nom. ined.)]
MASSKRCWSSSRKTIMRRKSTTYKNVAVQGRVVPWGKSLVYNYRASDRTATQLKRRQQPTMTTATSNNNSSTGAWKKIGIMVLE